MAAELTYRDGHVECSKCHNLVYAGDARRPDLCSDCVHARRAKLDAITAEHASGQITDAQRDEAYAAVE